MYFSRDEIKAELLDRQTEGYFDEDNISEWASQFIPVYYNQIIKDWQEMPNEFTDSWNDDGLPSTEAGIFDLMGIDLYNYYYATTYEIYNEIISEQESAE